MADTDILNPRILMHEAREADHPQLFSLALLNPSFILKQGCHTYGLGGRNQPAKRSNLAPLDSSGKCDERHMFWTFKFYSFYLLYNELPRLCLLFYMFCFLQFKAREL